MSRAMTNESVFVRFPRKRGIYEVVINRDTEQAIDRLQPTDEEYYELIDLRDESILWQNACRITDSRKAPERR